MILGDVPGGSHERVGNLIVARHRGGDVVGEYRRYLVRRRYATATVRGRVMVVGRWLSTDVDWAGATHHDVEDWIASVPVSPAVQRNYVSFLRSFYRWALREGLVDFDPTALVDPPRVGHRLPRPARDHEIAQVLAVADDELAAMIGLMAVGGLRCCEVAGLRWSDVDLNAGTVHVTGKGTKDRVVSLGRDALVLLAALDSVTGPVFRSGAGRPYSANRVSRIVCLAFRARGFSTTAHQLRHRAATTALQVPGSTILAVRDFLGHSSVATTQLYTKVAPGLVDETSRAISLPRPLAS